MERLEASSLARNRLPAAGADDLATLAHALLLAGAAVAVFLVAGAPQGSAGIFLVCAGAALVCCPPKVKVGGSLWSAAAALVACASLAFLPARWFPLPAWRKALEQVPVIALPATVTPVPWQTAFWLALLASTALVGLFMLAQPVRSKGLRSLALAAALVCGGYAALSIYARVTGWHYPFTGGATFGFFQNRNHAATFLITGSILAIGLLTVTLRDGRWIAGVMAAGCLTVCAAGLFFYSASRGGIIFLLAGMLLWIVGLGRMHRPGRLLVSFTALLLAGSILFFLSHGEAQTRIVALVKHSSVADAARALLPSGEAAPVAPAPSAPGEMPFDARILIFKDTLPLIRSFPITGTGLGTFAMVFPQYRNASLSELRVVHPESDWLMLLAEAGIPAFLCALAFLCLLARRLPPSRQHPYWPLRWGCIAAAAAALLHGFVDVPAHHVPLGWWILTLAGLGLSAGWPETSRRSRAQHAAFVLGGVAMFILGVQLIRAEWFGAAPLPPFAAERMEADFVQAYEHHDFGRAAQIARRATRAFPMDETFYYEWGALVQPFADSDADVDAAFEAERLLNPGPASVPFRQGEAWARYDSGRAADRWLEAFSKRQHMARIAGLAPADSVGFYRDLIERATKWPALQRRLLAAADADPALALVWLESARPELVPDEAARLSKDARFLPHLDAAERRRFLLAWYTAGDPEELTRFIEGRHDWRDAAWPVRLRQWVDSQQFERAVHEAADHYQIPLDLPAPGQEANSGSVAARESADPAAAFHAYWSGGNTVAARRVLAEATGAGADRVPPEIWRLKAAVAAQQADWAAAWQSLHEYIKAGPEAGTL